MLANIPRLVAAYYAIKPDPADPSQRVAFGTSGHRGSSRLGSFNEDHILATTQAICDYRAGRGLRGPLYLGMAPRMSGSSVGQANRAPAK